MPRRAIETGVAAGGLFAVLGLIAWVTGQPFVFPSLGPSAFALAFETRREKVRPRRVVGSHLIGALAGFAAYSVLASGVSLTAVPPALSIAGLQLILSGVVSVVVTGWGMLVTDTVHPPACATTLIVSLGLLSSAFDVGVIVVSVVGLVAVSELLE
ncbi:HPP family protein [Haloferax namakaokahaiae]|uniref:HPP family protein n=1 Tax=Haloferax namakaokahaiae TaxID=1748331 RepID=A0ABD5ZAV8_9EURY